MSEKKLKNKKSVKNEKTVENEKIIQNEKNVENEKSVENEKTVQNEESTQETKSSLLNKLLSKKSKKENSDKTSDKENNDKTTDKDNSEVIKLEGKEKRKQSLQKVRNSLIILFKLLRECITYKIILLIIAVLIVESTFTEFKKNVQKQINANTKVYLSSMVSESIEKVNLKINEEFSILRTMSLIYDEDKNIEFNVTKKILRDEVDKQSFIGVELLDTNKDALVSYGAIPNIESTDYIDKSLKGDNGISPIVLDEENKTEYIALSVPVTNKDNEVLGVLVSYYDINEFTQIIDTSSFEKVGTTFISQEDGTLVSRPESIGSNSNLFSILDSVNIKNGKSIAKLKKYIKNGQSGLITYGKGKYKRYICYNMIPDTDWYSVSIVSGNSIEPVAKKVSSLAVALAGRITTIFTIYIIVTLIIDLRKAKRKVLSQDKIKTENK